MIPLHCLAEGGLFRCLVRVQELRAGQVQVQVQVQVLRQAVPGWG